MISKAFAAAVLFAVPASVDGAQEQPSFDCAKASSSAEELICGDSALAQLDLRVSERYQAALEKSSSAEADDLRAMQRGWIKGRDECWKAADLRDCVEFAYLSREAELVALWQLEPPINVVTWACDGNPANEVVTAFFDTELSAVRFERGDNVTVGLQQRSGSGAKYDGPFGQSIWIKGDEATYRDADPDGQTFTCVATQ